MSKCPRCSSHIPFDASVCRYCGTEVESQLGGWVKLAGIALVISLIWDFIQWIWKIVVNIFTWIGIIINYPATIFSKLLGYNYDPEWWQTGITLVIEIIIILFLIDLLSDKKNPDEESSQKSD